jgi:hypothetical protein
MPRFSGKKTDTGVPVTIDRERYTEGDVATSLEGGVVLGEKPGNVAYPIQIDASGYLKVTGAGAGGTEYSDGDSNADSKGTLILGDDGTLLQNIAVDANGRLQVEVVEGEYDGVQYQDGAVVASPFGTVALGHDGSNVFPVVVDSNGYLQIEVLELPSDTFVVEGGALGKGVLLQGDDGTDRHNVAVDTAGNVQTDVVRQGKLAAWTQILVNINAATTTELKAAVTGHTYTVIGISLTVAGENNLTWKSNTTALSGPMDFGGSGEPHGWQANMWPHGLKCTAGEALKLTTTTTEQVSGFVMILDE